MYQIGDKPDNFRELLENANKIIGEKVGAGGYQYLGWGDPSKKMSASLHQWKHDIAFADNYVVNAQKIMLTWQV